MARFTCLPLRTRWRLGLIAGSLMALMLAGCASQQASEQEKEIRIAVALTQTAVALAPAPTESATPIAAPPTATPPPTAAPPTATPLPPPQDTATASPTVAAETATPLPTATVAATVAAALTATVATTSTLSATPCTNDSRFVDDLSVPDGTVLTPGQVVTKTWQVQNSGTCTWTPDYSWTFVEGAALNPTTALPVTGPVLAGQPYDFNVVLTAPTADGRYQGQWRLRDSQNIEFGQAVSYDISVSGAPTIAYFRSNQDATQPKGQIILSWDAANAFSGVFLRYNGGEEGVTAPGVKTLYPDKTTTYELVARNENGESVAQVTVQITTTAATPTPDPAAAPTILYFSATQSKVKAGEQVILSWDAADAFGGVFLRLADIEEGVIAPGVKSIYPQETVEYELIARNSNSEVRQKLKIEVAQDE